MSDTHKDNVKEGKEEDGLVEEYLLESYYWILNSTVMTHHGLSARYLLKNSEHYNVNYYSPNTFQSAQLERVYRMLLQQFLFISILKPAEELRNYN
jgi:hypothetical protein